MTLSLFHADRSLKIIRLDMCDILQYLPKVWKRAHGVYLFFSAIRKIKFSSDHDEFFLAVAIIGSNKLNLFQIFPTKERVGLKWISKFGNML